MPSVKSSSPTQSQGLTKSVTPTKSPGKEASPQKRADKKGKKKKKEDAEEEDDIIEVTEEGSEEPEAEAEPDEANAPAEAEVAGAEPDGAGAEAGVAGGESDAEVGKSQAEPKGRASPGSASTSWDDDEAPQPALMPTRVDPCIALADVLFCRCLAGPPPKKGFVSPDETRHLEPHLMLGITIDGLHSWLSNNKLHGSRTLVSAVPTGRDAQAAANRESAFDRRSVCERLQSSFFSGWQVGEANVFVSWPLDASITCLVEGLEYYLRAPAARGEPARERATTYFWICTSSLRYHSPEPPPGCVTAESLADISAEHLIYLDECALLMEVFEKTIVLIDRLEEPTMFSRMHCLRELALSQQKHAKLELVLSEAAAEAIDRSLRHDFTPVRRLLDALGTVDLWSAHCTDPRDARYVRNEAIRAGYGRGKGRAAVNSQLVELLRMLLVRLGRTLLAKVPAAERATSPVTRRVGTLVKEVELMGLRERHGPRHPSTLSAINYLATLHKENGDLILAEALYVECLQARRAALGNSDALTLISLNNLGTLLYELGRLPEAETLLAEAFASRRREHGALAPETLRSLHKLGVCIRAKGDYAQSVSHLTQALAGRRQALGDTHEETLRTMNDLGSAIYDRGFFLGSSKSLRADLDAALALYREALVTSRKRLGDAHPVTLVSMNNLGNCLHARGLAQAKFIPGRGPNPARLDDLSKAAALLRESLAMSQTVHGPRHVETLISASNLGSAMRSLGADSSDAAISQAAHGLLTEAVEGIADAWEGDLALRPRMRDALRPGLEDVLLGEQDGIHGEILSPDGAYGREGVSNPFEAAGAFLRGLMSVGVPPVPPAAQGSPLFHER